MIARGTGSGDGTTPSLGCRASNRALTTLALGALVALSGGLAYFDLYSTFEPWDDEGYMLLTVQHYLNGHSLYDEVRTPYGPAYYVYARAIHGPMGVPLTNDAARLISLVMWCLTAVLCGVTVFGVTGNLGFSALGYLAAFLHLRTYSHEPGHPQGVSGLLVAVVLLLPTLRAFERPRGRLALAAALGAATALLLLVKINVGVFMGVSLLVVVAATLEPGPLRRLIRGSAAGVILALPWVLMLGTARARPDLALVVARYGLFATLTAATVVGFAWYPAPRPWAGRLRPYHIAGAIAAFAAAAVALAAAVVATGTTVGGMIDSLVVLPRRITTEFLFLPNINWVIVGWACGGCLVASACLVWGRGAEGGVDAGPPGRRAGAVAALKVGFGCLVFLTTFRVVPVPERTMTFGAPFVWLVLMPPFAAGGTRPRGGPAANGGLARLVMATVAAVQILQAYPIAGSQVFFGSLAVVPAAIICLADGWAVLIAGTASGGLPAVARRRPRAALTTAVLTCYAGGVTAWVFAETYGRYAERVPLGLPGAEHVRVTEDRAAMYRELTDTVRTASDSFVVTTSLNSLYLWTGQQPPTRIPIGHELSVFTEDEQVGIVRAVLAHQRPLVVHNVVAGPDESKPMVREIYRRLRPWRRVGPFMLLVPKGAVDP